MCVLTNDFPRLDSWVFFKLTINRYYKGKTQISLDLLIPTDSLQSNTKLLKRVRQCHKVFEQSFSHPAASFVIGVLEDWQKTKGHGRCLHAFYG